MLILFVHTVQDYKIDINSLTFSLVYVFEYLLEGVRYYTALLRISRVTLHGVGFTRTGLTICEYGTIVPE